MSRSKDGMEMRNGKVVLEFFNPARIALAKEITNHPKLIARLQKHPQAEFEILLAEIALYCEIVLDGDYTQDDLDKLCYVLLGRLRKMHSPLIVIGNLH